MDRTALFAEPEAVASADDCYFYHVMEIPGHGLVGGEWDLRAGVDDYLGGVDLSAQRVLEIGPASGFLTFHMETAGAAVVSIELVGVVISAPYKVPVTRGDVADVVPTFVNEKPVK